MYVYHCSCLVLLVVILLSYSTTYIILHTCPLFCSTHMSPIVLYPNVPVPICPSINMFWYPYVLLPIFPVPKWPSNHQSKYQYLLVCIWPTTKFPSATSSTSHRLHPYKREIIVSFRWNTSQATTSLLIKAKLVLDYLSKKDPGESPWHHLQISYA